MSTTEIFTPMEASTEKTNLLGLSREKMEAFCVSLGEKPFRAQQLLKWIHHQGVDMELDNKIKIKLGSGSL